MNRAAATVVLFCAALAFGCHKAAPPETAASRSVPKGDAIWLTDPAGANEPGFESQLQRLGSVVVFLPAGEVSFEGARWRLREDPPPAHRLQAAPVALVVRPGPALGAALASAAGTAPEAAASAIAAVLAPRMGASGPYGRVIGVHVDFPFGAASVAQGVTLIQALRRGLPPATFVSISVRSSPSGQEDLKRLDPLVASADALVAFVFGFGAQGRADANVTDALRRPWWAAYTAAGHGTLSPADGSAASVVAEPMFDHLSGNPHVGLDNDLSLNDATESAFHLIARERAQENGLTLERGDRVSFRVPTVPEMLFQLGSNMAGRRFALGRVVVFEGASEGDRIFPIAALEDVLLGRALAPAWTASAQPAGRSAVMVGAANGAPHASIVSRLANWVEVDLAPSHPSDVQLGGFDRYEVYNASGLPVTLGRATRVRFFETLVMPREVIAPARVAVRGALPAACCRHRMHLIADAGPEIAGDWIEPPPPTPAAQKGKAPAKGKKK